MHICNEKKITGILYISLNIKEKLKNYFINLISIKLPK